MRGHSISCTSIGQPCEESTSLCISNITTSTIEYYKQMTKQNNMEVDMASISNASWANQIEANPHYTHSNIKEISLPTFKFSIQVRNPHIELLCMLALHGLSNIRQQTLVILQSSPMARTILLTWCYGTVPPAQFPFLALRNFLNKMLLI